MAEVKKKSGPISNPLKKKPPSFSNNGVSSSFKYIYDDVFCSSCAQPSSTFMEDDYAEIFGSSNSSNGSWSIPYSSVPILELERDKGFCCRRGERVDYGGVFGGFDNGSGNGDEFGSGSGFGLPDGEVLFDQLKKKAKTSSSNDLPRSEGRSIEVTRQECPIQLYDEQLPANGFSQSFDSKKQLEPEKEKVTVKATSKTRKAAHVRVNSFHESVVNKNDPPDTDSSFGGKKGNHYRHTSLDLGAQSSNTEDVFQKASGMSVLNLVDVSNDTSQPCKAATNGFYQSPDNTKDSEIKMDEIRSNRNKGKTYTPENHPIPESTHSLHKEISASNVEPSEESADPPCAQETVSSKTSVLNEPQITNDYEPQITNDVNLVEGQSKHSCSTSLDLDSKLNDSCDNTSQKPCGLSESTFDDPVESCEASSASRPSYMVKDDVSVDCGNSGKVKKKGGRSRMASVDLGDYKHSSDERYDGLKRKPRLGGSYSFDASHDPCAARVKVHPSMMYPSSSLPRFFPVESRYKISENSTGKCSQPNWDGGAGDSPPSLIEELDVNSDAAISAAALQRAIEEAELRIRMAKAFLQQEGQGSTNLRFKDTLRVRVSKENGVVNEVHKIKQAKLHKGCSPVVESEPKESCSPLNRKHAVETARRAPIFEDEKFFKNEKLADGEDSKVSNSITGDDKREGEWEPAKHFNQLLSGVKNKLASFISWQTEIEKKDAVKEVEATMKAQQQPEESEHDFRDLETFKRKRTEENEVTSMSSRGAMHGETKLQFVPEAVGLEKNLVSSLNLEQDKTENRVDSTPVATSLANFQFFAFRDQKVCDSSDREVEEGEPFETRQSEMVNEQEKVMDEVQSERIPFEGEEASQEPSDGEYVTQDSMRQDDTSQSNNVGLQNDKIYEEPGSLTDYNIEDFSVEEVCQGNTISKDDLCSLSRENIEMVEDLYSMARHDEKEPVHEEDEQDCMSAKSSLGSANEEYDELVEQPSSAGHDEKEVPCEEDIQDDMYRFTHVGSHNEENKEMMEECTQAWHEREDVDHEDCNSRSLTEKLGEQSTDHSGLFGDISQRTDEDNLGELQEKSENKYENVELLEESCKNFEFSDGKYECQENDRDQTETSHFEEVPGQEHGWEDIKQIKKQTEHVEEMAEEVNVQENSANEKCELNDNVFSSKPEEACKIGATTSSNVEALYWDEELERMDVTSISESEIDVHSPVAAQKASELLDEELPPSTQKSSELIGDKDSDVTHKLERMDMNSTSELDIDVQSLDEAQKASGLFEEEVPLSTHNSSELIEEESFESTHKPVELTEEEQETSLSTDLEMKLDRNESKGGLNGIIGNLEHENNVSLDGEPDLATGKKVVDVKAVDHESQCKLDSQTHYLHEARENPHFGVFDAASGQDADSSGVEAFHRRRRWFDHGVTIATPERPSILEGKGIESEIFQEVLDDSELAGNVEIHADKLDSSAVDVTHVRDAEVLSNPEIVRTNVETTPTRRKWFVKEGKPEPVSLFNVINVKLEIPLESMNESLPHVIPDNSLDKLNAKSGDSLNVMKFDVAVNGEKGKQSGEAAPRRKRWFESGENVGTSQKVKLNEDNGLNVEIDQESKAKVEEEQLGKHDNMSIPHKKNDVYEKEKPEKEYRRDMDEVNRRGKEKEKERIAVERAIREARERAFAEAKERARREVADRPNVEARPKVAGGVQEKLGKGSSDVTSSLDNASVEAKLKAERAAVERATSEARERALQKALSEKGSHRSREQVSNNQSSRGSDSFNNNGEYSERVDGVYVESAQRRKARLERQTRTMERAAKALEEKNRRDLLAQKDQATKNMMADLLDADVKRWCTGKEGNLRALLSTLQYVLGPESGWQPVSLTDLIASTAVRKAYKKATLCVHPDKLQQRDATIQQKYICEKVFDLLKEAWGKFNPDER